MVCIVSYKLLHMSSWMYTLKPLQIWECQFIYVLEELFINIIFIKELILFEYADSIEYNIIHNAIFD